MAETAGRMDARAARVAAVVAEVVGEAVRSAGARGVVLRDDGSPEARLAIEWCGRSTRVWPVAPPEAEGSRPASGPIAAGARAARGVIGRGEGRPALALLELHRFAVRLEAAVRDALTADPANKTALLLGGAPPPESLLPLGDLYASRVDALAGGWTAPSAVAELAVAAGGIAGLDRILMRLIEERRPAAEVAADLPEPVGAALMAAFAAGRWHRSRIGLVPKLGERTLGIDLFA